MKTINFEQFEDIFQPIKNHIDENASYDGFMFETYGEEIDYVKSIDNNKIWTIISTENEESWFIPGFHIVDRLGFIICSNPWEDEEIQVDDNEHLTQEKCVFACFEFWEDNGFEFDLNQIKNFYPKENYTVGEAKYIAMNVYTEITGQDELSFEQQDNIHDYYSNL